jgi:hypothetical protein
MKEENKKIIVGRWVKKAEEDNLSAQSLLRHRDGTASVACFLSQQMGEKYLKALLIFFDLELIKIHDLIKLSTFLPLTPIKESPPYPEPTPKPPMEQSSSTKKTKTEASTSWMTHL